MSTATREGIDAFLAVTRVSRPNWHQVASLEEVPPMPDSGFGMETQSRGGPGYTAYFYHFHDGPVQGVDLDVYYVENQIRWEQLASDIIGYVALKETQHWR